MRRPMVGARRAFAMTDALSLLRQVSLPDLVLHRAGWFLLAVVLVYFVILKSPFRSSDGITAWIFIYVMYLLTLEWIGRVKPQFYERTFFRLCRIHFNIFMISWLAAIDAEAQTFLWFLYTLPIFASVVYFDTLFWPAVALIASSLGFHLSMAVFTYPPRLGLSEYSAVVAELLVTAIILRYLVRRPHLSSMRFAEIAKTFHETLDLSSLLKAVGLETLQLTNAEQVLVIIIDPTRKTLVDAFFYDFELRPGVSTEELASECSVLKKGDPFHSQDLVTEYGSISFYHKYFTNAPRSVLAEPIFSKDGRPLGVLSVGSRWPGKFDRRTIGILRFISYQVGGSIDSYFGYSSAQIREKRRAILADVSRKLIEAENESEIAHVLVTSAEALIPAADGCVLHKYDDRMRDLRPLGASHVDPATLGKSVMHLGTGIAGVALKELTVENVPDVTQDKRFDPSAQVNDFLSLMVAPVYLHGRDILFGTLSVHSKVRYAFEEDDRSILSDLAFFGASAMAAKALDRHRFYLARIVRVVQSLDVGVSEEGFWEQVVEAACEVFDFELARFRILDEFTQELVTVAVSGLPKQIAENLIGHKTPLEGLEPLLVDEYKIGECYLIDHAYEVWNQIDPSYFYEVPWLDPKSNGWGTNDALLAPLKGSRGNLIGLLTLDLPETGRHPPREAIEALGIFVNTLAWVVETRRVYEWWIHQGLEDDLHEVINLAHSGVSLWIDAITEWLRRDNFERVRLMMPELAERTRTMIGELRSIHRAIRAPTLDTVDLTQALHSLASEWSVRLNPPLKIMPSEDLGLRFHPFIEFALYRIAQGALANAAKHSHANERSDGQGRIWMDLRQIGQEVVLTIGDNGVGFNPGMVREGYGFKRMNYWAKQAHGELIVNSDPRQGTVVVARLPLRNTEP